MNTLVKSIVEHADEHNDLALTANGAVTLSTSKNVFVDLFSIVGSARHNVDAAVAAFKDAYYSDSKTAFRILLWARDARGGAGERAVFRAILLWLATKGRTTHVLTLIKSGMIEELGRWDDYVGLMTAPGVREPIRLAAATRVLNAIKAGNQLAAKWCPRKGVNAAKIRQLFRMSPKLYRTTLVAATNVVETKMCAKDWERINYSHVPSVAMARYTKAFSKNSLEAYPAYVEALVNGEVKAKAEALFPYDVLRTARHGDATVANEQWKALPDYIDGDATLLPMIDVSGSMTCPVSGSVTAMDIAVSLGIYLAERNKSAFKDVFMTFETQPAFVTIRPGTITEKVNQVQHANWGGSTDLQAAFELLLRTAVENQVPAEDMPDYLFIVSDMEFNEATNICDYYRRPAVKADTNFAAIEQKYQAAGYTRPNIIFWNVNARGQNVQVDYDQNNTAMISGFSPSIIRPVLNAEHVTPVGVMEMAIMAQRYDVEGLTT